MSVMVIMLQVIHMFEQFDMSDAVITLVNIAIGNAEPDDPNLVRFSLTQ